MIRKSGKKWCLYSKSKGKGGKRRKLGCYSSKKGAEGREKQVNMFKHMKEHKNTMKLSLTTLKKLIKEEIEELESTVSLEPNISPENLAVLNSLSDMLQNAPEPERSAIAGVVQDMLEV
tara:strand:- start:116 stop:472 length:357 start_codon:yes stop_codon:yes gene_type:complete